MIPKGTWVQIEVHYLEPNQRYQNLPIETQQVAYKGRIKGFLVQPCLGINQLCHIETVLGFIEKGMCIAIEPSHTHNFGEFVCETQAVALQITNLNISRNQDEH